MSIRVKILNPLPDCSQFASHGQAARFVRRGRAQWANSEQTEIKFHAHIQIHEAKRMLSERERLLMWSTGGYDGAAGTGRITMREARHIPIAAAYKLGLSA